MTPPRFTIVKEPAPRACSTAKAKVLLAEDDPAIRRMLSKRLEEYEVIEAADGEEAFHLAQQTNPDVLLLDSMMPRRDGLQVTRALRSLPLTKNTPILLLTATNDDESKEEALQAGVSDFVLKPCSLVELQHRIQNMVFISQTQKELAQSRELLMRSEKLSSLGELSAGIMHEINNPLNYAMTGVHALKMLGSFGGDTRQEFDDVVQDIDEGLSRVSQIASDLRSFSRMGRVERKRVNLAEVVHMSERLLSDRLLQVQYESAVPEDLFVYANDGQVSQVLINLLVNAVDALEEAGRPVEQRIVRLSAEKTAAGVYLAVWDNGCGISQEKQTLLFDPFFTTKEAGKGTGLGLSVCHRMLEAHGAALQVDSVEGQYTRFYTVLPNADLEGADLQAQGRELSALVSASLS